MFSLLGFSSSIFEAYFKARPYILLARACLYENIKIWKAAKQNYQMGAEPDGDAQGNSQCYIFNRNRFHLFTKKLGSLLVIRASTRINTDIHKGMK